MEEQFGQRVSDYCVLFNIKNYTINDDESIDVDGDVDFSGIHIESFPIKFNKINGNFISYKNKLTSLKNGPKEITGYFDLGFNNLTSLEGSPISVGRGFNCDGNNLTDLKGSPKLVGGDFMCNDNKLTSLESSLEKIGGSFNCSNNKLTSLKFSPMSVDGDFNCSSNKINDLEGFSKWIGGRLYCSSTDIECMLNNADIEFIMAFNTFKVLKDGVVNLKRLKYVLGIFNKPIYLREIEKNYTIK